jgi:hypothetical protein
LDPQKRDSPEFGYVAAACSLRIAFSKFKSRNWSVALQHADASLNSLKLLRAKVKLSELPENPQLANYTQTYNLLPALSPQQFKELTPGNAVDRCDHVLL